jgi:pimeloyl-ACP methyl ester carboxylesterase
VDGKVRKSRSEEDRSTAEMPDDVRVGSVREPSSHTRRVLSLSTGDQVLIADSAPGARGPIVLAIPGWKGSDLGLRALCAPLVRRRYRVVTLNLPGMGMSPTTTARRYPINHLVDIVDEVVDGMRLAAGPVILVGHSFGATLATSVASRRRGGLRGLVLVSPVVIPLHERPGIAERLSWMAVEASAALLPRLPLSFGHRVVRSRVADSLAAALLARRGVSGFRRIREASSSERCLIPDPCALADHYAGGGAPRMS